MGLAKALREAMGLNLFNMDVIRDGKDFNKYFIIDINYFLAYLKLPCFEPFMTGFLRDCVRNKIANGRVPY
jgi:inositol-1,3,4-trisphosphate 5/6-kinase/inositol-tetrakisphosphate 1-kinase